MKIFIGRVISTKMSKTATVAVERTVIHPLYKKRFRRIKKYHVHDELGVKVGEAVKFVASKPYSKLKKWKVIEKTEYIRGKNKIVERKEKTKVGVDLPEIKSTEKPKKIKAKVVKNNKK